MYIVSSCKQEKMSKIPKDVNNAADVTDKGGSEKVKRKCRAEIRS